MISYDTIYFIYLFICFISILLEDIFSLFFFC